MSARERLARVDDMTRIADSLRLDPLDTDYEPGVERLATLLEALVQAQVATAEALVEANDMRALSRRPTDDDQRHAGTPTRPYSGA